jgi:hypothetical protein
MGLGEFVGRAATLAKTDGAINPPGPASKTTRSIAGEGNADGET